MSTSSPDLKLLALFTERETYEKYKGIAKKEGIVLSDTGRMLADYEAYYNAYPSHSKIDFDEFKTFLRTIRHSEWKEEKHAANDIILAGVFAKTLTDSDRSILDHFLRKEAAAKIIDIATDVATGSKSDFAPIIEIIEKTKKEAIVIDDVSGLFGPSDLSKVLESRVRTHGLEWRLECLNTSAGPLRGGDFVFLAARPEAGKTSWLCSEMTHMVKFLDENKDAVIFNPEEGGGRLFLRLVTSALGEDIITVAADEKHATDKYEKEVGRTDRIRVVEPSGGISTRDIERVLEKGTYGLVAINVADKIRLPYKYGTSDKEVDKYRAVAYWLRECANRYSVPILAVAQADAAAEGVKWLTQSMLYGSKTGVQGEVDLLIGMGYDRTIEGRRYLALLKNKLPGGPRTVPAQKHANIEVAFDPNSGRYSDI